MSAAVEIEKVNKEVDCPHCKGKFDIEIERKKPKVKIEEQETTIKQENHTHSHSEPPREDPHETLAKMLPKGVNFGKCANGECNKKIKNAKGITTKFKTCPNCRTNTVPKSNDFCPTCGKESDEFDESDVEIESDEGD